ncbi:MAG: radical SAM protein [Proteobacteria bacterium]|nr:radical SAM protein [Pseudomonadota bacterium]
MSAKDISRHPCFNKESAGECGRVHLPVAPKCNIQCNYCNRKYDCVNESRPGVTSSVLKPFQAAEYMDKVIEREPRITVAGIAGPGDPFANPAETLETVRLLNKKHPGMLFCLSSNGLNLLPYLDDLAELNVTHVTVTMNAVAPVIGAKIYSWVKDGNVVYRGEQGAALLLEKQLAAIKGLKERGITVKINTIVIPGVNDQHIPEVTKIVAALGVDIQNLIPMKPNADTLFCDVPEPNAKMIKDLRAVAGKLVKQMTHCKRCRADAVGLLSDDQSVALCGTLQACSKLKPRTPNADRPYVAIATREGMLVNQHLGEASTLQIWGQGENGFKLIETRQAPRPGCGPKRWEELARSLSDCRSVLSSAMGDTPKMLLEDYGIKGHIVSGFIEDALDAAFSGREMGALGARMPKAGCAASGCSGGGEGCG